MHTRKEESNSGQCLLWHWSRSHARANLRFVAEATRWGLTPFDSLLPPLHHSIADHSFRHSFRSWPPSPFADGCFPIISLKGGSEGALLPHDLADPFVFTRLIRNPSYLSPPSIASFRVLLGLVVTIPRSSTLLVAVTSPPIISAEGLRSTFLSLPPSPFPFGRQ